LRRQSNDISLESCHACMHARTHSHGIPSNLLVTCVRCSAKHRGRLRNAPTEPLCATYRLPAACHVRDEATTHKSQQGKVGGEGNGFLAAVVGTTMRSSVPFKLLISCILHVPACSSNRCAVQMIDPRSPLPAHPRAAPGKEKVGRLVEDVVCGWFSRNRV
jgi:hypothetical protein